nr:PREDICTED: syntaphilin [Latimeria chalumnae]|eukprot:XP_014348295.1 PREDICTED: syntaphilin [Latimeria chalumnae]
MKTIIKENKSLKRRLEATENQIRATNIRVIGLTEEVGDENLCSLMESWISTTLKLETAEDPIIVERTFRIPLKQTVNKEKRRTIIVTVSSMADRDRILRAAKKLKEIFYEGHKVLFFPNLSPETQTKRHALVNIKKEFLEMNISASMLYPAKLRVCYSDKTYLFWDAADTEKFLQSRKQERRHIKYASCSDNHGIKPPTPEQYLTPLQQKEVCIRHLRAQLKDTLDKLQDRDTEIEDLKTQLARMQEDWIEEECHRVEAQLALKEARKEIQRLKQVIDTVKNNLVEKDKGIQKYFNDINLQNKKLENLLQSMEMAQNGAMRDEGAAESAGGSPARSLTRSSTYTKLSDQAIMADKNTGDLQNNSAEETNTADSGFVAAEDSMSRTDLLEHSLLSSALEISGGLEMALQMPCLAATRLSRSSTCEKLGNFSMDAGVQASDFKEQAIQTDYVQYCPELDTIMEKVLRSHAGSPSSPTSVWLSEGEELGSNLENQTQIFGKTLDLVPSDPNSAILVTDTEGVETLANPHGSLSTHNPTVCQPAPASQAESTVCDLDEDTGEAAQETSLRKSYWSRHFIIDLLAVAVPVVPTVAWLCRSQRREGQPVYNISSLLRGCCTVALHSIRKMSGRSVGDDNNGASNA